MDIDSIQLLLRNLGSLIAGFLITHGAAKAGSEEVIIGAVIGIGMVVYSWWGKRVAKRKAEQEKVATAAVALALPAHADEKALNIALAKEELPPVELKS